MTTQTAPETIIVSLTTPDLQHLARALFSDAVQGSRLDLMAYDADASRQRFWLGEAIQYAKGVVKGLEDLGKTVQVIGDETPAAGQA